MVMHSFYTAPFWLALAGVSVAFVFYMLRPQWSDAVRRHFSALYTLLDRKYWADELYQNVFAAFGRWFGHLLWNVGDVRVIDGAIVNGSARGVGKVASIVRHVQTGYLYHYAFAMFIGLLGLIAIFVFLRLG